MAVQLTPGRYTLDRTGNSVAFRHKTFWGLATVRGSFGSVEGSGELAADGTGSGSLTVAVASLDTKNQKRDTHLRSKDFFDAEAHPEVVFTAARITPSGEDAAQVEGEISVRGTSRALSFPARLETQSADSVVLSASVEIDRGEFGMTWNQLGMLKGSATMDIRLRFTAAN